MPALAVPDWPHCAHPSTPVGKPAACETYTNVLLWANPHTVAAIVGKKFGEKKNFFGAFFIILNSQLGIWQASTARNNRHTHPRRQALTEILRLFTLPVTPPPPRLSPTPRPRGDSQSDVLGKPAEALAVALALEHRAHEDLDGAHVLVERAALLAGRLVQAQARAKVLLRSRGRDVNLTRVGWVGGWLMVVWLEVSRAT